MNYKKITPDFAEACENASTGKVSFTVSTKTAIPKNRTVGFIGVDDLLKHVPLRKHEPLRVTYHAAVKLPRELCQKQKKNMKVTPSSALTGKVQQAIQRHHHAISTPSINNGK